MYLIHLITLFHIFNILNTFIIVLLYIHEFLYYQLDNYELYQKRVFSIIIVRKENYYFST